MAEKGSHSVDEVNIVRVLTQFNVAVMKVSRVIRQMLQVFDGYECKEPEPGKLTLAFQYAPLPQCSISFRATCSTPNQQSRGPDTESILKHPSQEALATLQLTPVRSKVSLMPDQQSGY